MSASLDTCSLCGAGAEVTNPLVQDDFYDDVRIHLHCLNSQAGREWQAERQRIRATIGTWRSSPWRDRSNVRRAELRTISVAHRATTLRQEIS